MELTQETLASLLQNERFASHTFNISIHYHTSKATIADASARYFTDWFRQAYVLLKGGYLLVEDTQSAEIYKLSIDNIKNGLEILQENHRDIYDRVSVGRWTPDYADAVIQCALFGRLK